MLTKTQKEYLCGLSQKELTRKVVVEDWNLESLQVANAIISEIEEYTVEKVLHMGSSSLQIAGEKDIDLFIFNKEISKGLIAKINDLLKCYPVNFKWKFIRNGFKITLKIANPEDSKRKEQLLFFEVLKSNPLLRKKYEFIKTKNSESFEKYIIAKMDFVTRIVNLFDEKNRQRIKHLTENGCAIENNHIFINKSLHSSQSFDIRALIRNELLVNQIIEELLQNTEKSFDIVVGIPRNGDILGQKVAIMTGKKFISSKNISLTPLKNKKVLVVDDTVVTGETIVSTVDTIKKAGGMITGAIVICCRQNIPDILFQNDEYKFMTYIIQDDVLFGYQEEVCPYCKIQIPFSNTFGFYKNI